MSKETFNAVVDGEIIFKIFTTGTWWKKYKYFNILNLIKNHNFI